MMKVPPGQGVESVYRIGSGLTFAEHAVASVLLLTADVSQVISSLIAIVVAAVGEAHEEERTSSILPKYPVIHRGSKKTNTFEVSAKSLASATQLQFHLFKVWTSAASSLYVLVEYH